MKSMFYEPYKYWDPFIERDDRPGVPEEDTADDEDED